MGFVPSFTAWVIQAFGFSPPRTKDLRHFRALIWILFLLLNNKCRRNRKLVLYFAPDWTNSSLLLPQALQLLLILVLYLIALTLNNFKSAGSQFFPILYPKRDKYLSAGNEPGSTCSACNRSNHSAHCAKWTIGLRNCGPLLGQKSHVEDPGLKPLVNSLLFTKRVLCKRFCMQSIIC